MDRCEARSPENPQSQQEEVAQREGIAITPASLFPGSFS